MSHERIQVPQPDYAAVVNRLIDHGYLPPRESSIPRQYIVSPNHGELKYEGVEVSSKSFQEKAKVLAGILAAYSFHQELVPVCDVYWQQEPLDDTVVTARLRIERVETKPSSWLAKSIVLDKNVTTRIDWGRDDFALVECYVIHRTEGNAVFSSLEEWSRRMLNNKSSVTKLVYKDKYLYRWNNRPSASSRGFRHKQAEPGIYTTLPFFTISFERRTRAVFDEPFKFELLPVTVLGDAVRNGTDLSAAFQQTLAALEASGISGIQQKSTILELETNVRKKQAVAVAMAKDIMHKIELPLTLSDASCTSTRQPHQ